jgi:hypothetical protein
VHSEEFGVFVSGGVEEHSKVAINHFIVPHEHGRRCEISFISVFLLSLGLVELEAFAQLDHF